MATPPAPVRDERPDSDLQQIEDLRQAKPEAFHRFYEEWFPRVHAFALRRTGEPDAAEALTERIFRRVLVELPSFSGRFPLSEWLLAHASLEAARRGEPASSQTRDRAAPGV